MNTEIITGQAYSDLIEYLKAKNPGGGAMVISLPVLPTMESLQPIRNFFSDNGILMRVHSCSHQGVTKYVYQVWGKAPHIAMAKNSVDSNGLYNNEAIAFTEAIKYACQEYNEATILTP